ncbi:MAG TPA: fasciclin domain-containing protein [Actinoplanes sp.]|jgi:uncharacterized surface protein with fasciclin (FAS1) repeats|nr:fasciclin domain-containing protein [Actinoplanes sp.]
MPSPRANRGLAVAAAAALVALAGCSSDSDTTSAGATAAPASSAPSAAPAQAAPFGPACGGLPSVGPGSPAELAKQPVASAAAQTPALSTLAAAVTKAGLVDTLNNAQNIAVFAPVNDAFAKVPQATLNQVLADQQALTNILKYHVVGQRPTNLDSASLTTLQGGQIKTAKSSGTYTANDATILCGNIQTANATVYLIDTVLMPTT